jgi:hypothetical protein
MASLQRLFPALAVFAFVITLLKKESPCIDRIPDWAAVGEEVLPNFKNPKVAFRVCNHLFVWLCSPSRFTSLRTVIPSSRFSGGCLDWVLPGERGWSGASGNEESGVLCWEDINIISIINQCFYNLFERELDCLKEKLRESESTLSFL